MRRKLSGYEKQRRRKQAVSKVCGGWRRKVVDKKGGKVVCFTLQFP
jgi:hypothetical protein